MKRIFQSYESHTSRSDCRYRCCVSVSAICSCSRYFAAGKPATSATLRLLQDYSWLENVAELCAVVQGASELAGEGSIDRPHLPAQLHAATKHAETIGLRLPREGIKLEAVEQGLIRQALAQAHGNKTRAAALLGLTRYTLLDRMEKCGITDPYQP